MRFIAPTSQTSVSTRLLLLICAWETSTALIALSWYRSNYKPSLWAFIASPPGWVFGCATLASCGLGYMVIRRGLHAPRTLMQWTVVANLALVGALIGAGEIALRSLAIRDLGGEHIGSLLIRPRGWDAVVERYTRMIEKFETHPTFYVGDAQLGWILGKDRQSEDGLSYTSAEGIRSPSAGFSYTFAKTTCRIAIVGDSFAFGDEVSYEESWGAYLEEELGGRCQVLNFAVGGHSIGQMYARFERDVLPWRPDVVILGFTDGALTRTMGVYGFLMMTDWECPWAQPRFVSTDEGPVVINNPLPTPREIFSSSSIRELPHIKYDRWFSPSEWEQANWGPVYLSYGFRWLTSIYPLHEQPRQDVSDEALNAVNTSLFKAFMKVARSNQVSPVLLYLPIQQEYGERSVRPMTHDIMKEAGLKLVDATPCVGQVAADERFLHTGDHHYAPKGSQAVARCVRPHVQQAFIAKQKADGLDR